LGWDDKMLSDKSSVEKVPAVRAAAESELNIDAKKRGEAIIEYVSAATSMLTGGLSETVMLPIRRVVQRRLRELDELLIAEMRAGLVTSEAIIDEDRLASFVLRVGRAAIEGTAKRKLRIIARYFFRTAPTSDFDEGQLADFATIAEQLTDNDMRCLAVLKCAEIEGHFEREIEGDDQQEKSRLRYAMDSHKIFASEQDFNEAVIALVRFGFIDMASAWGGIALFATGRCRDYIHALDLENLEP